ncbi:hypothetical protein R3F64_18315 [Halomonas sp. 5021]|uniref:hypothetical protein n=1 Tax=Halomonas sp. 5021 TaxID=3082156 RepID=UPI002FCB1720
MLAERIKQWPERWEEKGRLEGLQEGLQEGRQEGLQEGQLEAKCSTARNLLALGVLSNEQIADVTGLTVEDIAQLWEETKH